MHNYEVEIKVLLGTEAQKDAFMSQVRSSFPALAHSYSESQRNHYFEGGSLDGLLSFFGDIVTPEEKMKLENIRDTAKSFSVRTRGTPTQTIIVVKATVNDESSSNGTARIEWEVDLAPMTLEKMDVLVLEAGFSYQAKWSREREGYQLNDWIYNTVPVIWESQKIDSMPYTVLCLDKNAGYGYLAEFERVIDDAALVDSTRAELLAMIWSLWYAELDQARLSRMFDFYNKNWRDYYGTENVFTVE